MTLEELTAAGIIAGLVAAGCRAVSLRWAEDKAIARKQTHVVTIGAGALGDLPYVPERAVSMYCWTEDEPVVGRLSEEQTE